MQLFAALSLIQYGFDVANPVVSANADAGVMQLVGGYLGQLVVGAAAFVDSGYYALAIIVLMILLAASILEDPVSPAVMILAIWGYALLSVLALYDGYLLTSDNLHKALANEVIAGLKQFFTVQLVSWILWPFELIASAMGVSIPNLLYGTVRWPLEQIFKLISPRLIEEIATHVIWLRNVSIGFIIGPFAIMYGCFALYFSYYLLTNRGCFGDLSKIDANAGAVIP